MLQLIIQEPFGIYTIFGLRGSKTHREQFFNIISNHKSGKQIRLLELGPQISYFLLNSIVQFEEILISARINILSMLHGYQTTPVMINDAHCLARQIIDETPRGRFVTPPEEIVLHNYIAHKGLDDLN